ncbi:MAG: carboxymuconolactone decarboxylase family protein [Alphaproteobacteria bacterium]|nr:carboxymuconolactone decarboxylase family protein [Alphaproteobacteria bacterium]
MAKDYIDIAAGVSKSAAALRKAIPGQMQGFAGLGAATYKDDALPGKFKELIALAIGIAGRCDGCVAYHAKMAFEKGASREEVAETIGVAIQMGGGPSMVYGGEALAAYDAFADEDPA